ncbi:MAG: hypothetical protein QUS14_07250 [Pyrinomonadaceae bacterium]|nr:hypothetical protein [Pyrinomonadaceae bacterium]
MDAAHLHLMLNHIPLLGTVFGLPVLLAGILLKNNALRIAGLLMLLVAALAAIPVYLTGEPAEEIVENLPGVGHDQIEAHEDFAMFALISAIITGVIAAAALAFDWMRKQAAALLSAVALVAALVTAGLMGQTANLGGEIRHTELRGDQAAVQADNKIDTKKQEKDDDDH